MTSSSFPKAFLSFSVIKFIKTAAWCFEKGKEKPSIIKRQNAGSDLPVFWGSRLSLANNNSWCIFPRIIHTLFDIPQVWAAGSYAENIHTFLHLCPRKNKSAVHQLDLLLIASFSPFCPTENATAHQSLTGLQGKEMREVIKHYTFKKK